MAFLLDTCALSEMTKPQPNVGYMEWLQQQLPDELYICSLSLAEIEKGIQKLHSGQKRASLEVWLQDLEGAFAEKCLGFGTQEAKAWGKMVSQVESKGIKLPAFDSIIAATAYCHQLTVITRNEKDFKYAPVLLHNPWSEM